MMLGNAQVAPRFEIEPLEGEVERTVYKYVEKPTGRTDKHGNEVMTHELVSETITEPAGYMAYFPRGHSIRVRNEAELKQLGLVGPAGYTDMSGELADEDLAQMMPSQRSLKNNSARITRQNSKRSAATKSSDQLANPEGE